ncbi:NAD(P)-dependent oxidoreductase [Aquincola sp. MAHUQ-54]|uniref:NAD(P)-dependent oxidoreductase n=1 Tax=Aquincola agrisoli TaxID=3119538 RepID=A0AAW9QE08_9BURK
MRTVLSQWGDTLDADLRACRRADHVVLAAPGTPQTRHIVDAAALAHARPGLHLVNVARGSLVDQDALLAALDAGRIDSASLDVTEPEPLPAGHPFYTHPRVRLSPHTSAISPAQQTALVDKFVRNLARFDAGERLEDLLDAQRRARGY